LRNAVEKGGITALLANWSRQSADFARDAAPVRLY